MGIPKQVDVLVLEDNTALLELILDRIPAELTIESVKESKSLRDFLEQERYARLYFLDDEVPEYKGAAPDHAFINNSALILQKRPDGKVFYIGGTPDEKIRNYCSNRGIEIVEKLRVGDKARQLLLKS